MPTGAALVVQTHFVNVTDPRVDRGQNHSLIEMIFLALTATLCGAQGWVDVERFAKSKREWFRRYVPLKHGIPSHDTFGRVFGPAQYGRVPARHARLGRRLRRLAARTGNRHRRKDLARIVRQSRRPDCAAHDHRLRLRRADLSAADVR